MSRHWFNVSGDVFVGAVILPILPDFSTKARTSDRRAASVLSDDATLFPVLTFTLAPSTENPTAQPFPVSSYTFTTRSPACAMCMATDALVAPLATIPPKLEPCNWTERFWLNS